MNIPSPNQCFFLIRKMEMMEHIVDHSVMVKRVAETLTDLLIAANYKLKKELIVAGAILHDITKTQSFTTGEKHAETGGALLASLGYPEVGEIIRQHVILDKTLECGTEAGVVNYADKRVLHDRVVPLEERLSYIMERYGTSDEATKRINTIWKKTQVLEKILFKDLGTTPDCLEELVHTSADLKNSSQN